MLDAKRSREAERALKNFYRHPGANLYDNMVNRTDTYRVALYQKPAQTPREAMDAPRASATLDPCAQQTKKP